MCQVRTAIRIINHDGLLEAGVLVQFAPIDEGRFKTDPPNNGCCDRRDKVGSFLSNSVGWGIGQVRDAERCHNLGWD